MSRRLAEEILNVRDLDLRAANKLLTNNKNEIDEEFYAALREACDKYVQEQEYETSIRILRILFESGEVMRDSYIKALSHLLAARVEFKRRNLNGSLGKARRCTEECDKATDPRRF